MFFGAAAFNQPLDSWDTSSVTDMSRVFVGAASFSQPLNGWDTSSVTDMSSVFVGAASFNQPLDSWDVSSVTDMSDMFRGASSFNQNISSWDVSSVTDMSNMFDGAHSFNQPLDSWDVSSVAEMRRMFWHATAFNQPLDSWDTSSVADMFQMFYGAAAFNQPLDSWDVSSVADMFQMFHGAASINLGSWYVTLDDDRPAVSATDRIAGVISPQNDYLANHYPKYRVTGAHADLFEVVDSTTLRLKPGQSVTLGTTYQVSVTATAGSDLYSGSSHHWVIPVAAVEPVDSLLGAPDHAFVTTWKTDTANQAIRFPVSGSSITIDWGDGSITSGVAGPQNHTYADPGTYAVIVTGGLERFHLGNGPGSASLSSIDQWGNSSWTNMKAAFYGASKMVYRAVDAPDLSRVADMSQMFRDAAAFNGDISSWDTSSVTDMSSMFYGATAFNQPLDTWDTSSVTDMSGMFRDTTSFNKDISSWDVSSATYMSYMFAGAASFNQPLHTWDVSSVIDTSEMFQSAVSFNQPLDTWDVSSVANMAGMFHNATAFNQPLDTWDVSSVAYMFWMFDSAVSFNQDISAWNVSSVANMAGMFHNATAFNQPLDTWDVSSVANMAGMFADATAFNRSLDGWDVSAVTDMVWMFGSASSFDQNLGGWYVAIGSMSINRTDVPGVVGTISAQNSFLDGQNPTYRIEPGGDSDRFVITDGSRLSMISAAADQALYTVTITASGDSIFGNDNSRRTVEVTLVDDVHDTPPAAGRASPVISESSPVPDGFVALDGANGVEVFGSGDRTYAIVTSHNDNGVQIMDVTDPANPSPVQQEVTDGLLWSYVLLLPYHMDVFGGGDRTYAVITTIIGGTHIIIDITDPANSTLVWPVDSASYEPGQGFITLFADVFESGDRTYALTASLLTGTRIVDIADPSNPALV